MADIFGKPTASTVRPITADQIQILWSNTGGGFAAVFQANNFQATYQQQINRRYTLNSAMNLATIYPGRPQGTITIGRLMIDQSALPGGQDDLLQGNLAGFDVCQQPAIITWSNVATASSTGKCDTVMGTYTARGCWVQNYGFQADADSLVVLDNVTIEFLQLEYTSTNSGVASDVIVGNPIS